MGFLIGVDTGGTFTDVIAIDYAGLVTNGKALTAPAVYTRGIPDSSRMLAEELQLSTRDMLAQTRLLVFSTTVATNTMITRSGARNR